MTSVSHVMDLDYGGCMFSFNYTCNISGLRRTKRTSLFNVISCKLIKAEKLVVIELRQCSRLR